MKRVLLSLILFFPANWSVAQTNDYSADVKSVDAIIAAMYDVITGEPNTPRDWNRFKNLFAPEGRMIPTRKNDKGEVSLKALTPDEYVQLFQPRIPTGFYERELARKTETFGTVTHAFSTYETKDTKDGAITNRGINSIQLFKDKDRYYIVNIFWCAESMGFALPERYLK